jgi:L-arabinokinase
MGYRIIADAAGLPVKTVEDAPHVVEVDDAIWNGYLANITPREFQTRFASLIPTQMTGRDFIERYTGTTDRVTRIDPARTYAVRAPTLYPIEENERAAQFKAILQLPIDEAALHSLAQLMYAANASYAACGLASPATDLLVNLVQEATPATGLYGAKITGGGSGGAVAILGRSGADKTVAAIAHRYTELTGRAAYIFRGSSPGAYSTPVQELVI